MADDKPIFLVNPNSEPVAIKVAGRASFQNVGPLRDFLKASYASSKRCFVFDFSDCTGMDSTVLGVIAGCALELRKLDPKGSLVLSRLNERNQQLVRSLGLHRIATIDIGKSNVDIDGARESLSAEQLDELDSARLCLEAHEKLVEADGDNRGKFQDVISFLKNRVGDKGR